MVPLDLDTQQSTPSYSFDNLLLQYVQQQQQVQAPQTGNWLVPDQAQAQQEMQASVNLTTNALTIQKGVPSLGLGGHVLDKFADNYQCDVLLLDNITGLQ
jgi:hypothetical protein